MGYTVETKSLPSGFTVEVVTDDDPENPTKNWDMVGTMVLWSQCRYNFGHKTVDRDTLLELSSDPNNIVLPVYLYDHSGITINTSGFSCPWDSGQVGIMYCTKEKAVHEFGKKICTKKVREAAIRCMVNEVECVDQYLTGQVYGFLVLDPDGEELDSCWGFFGESDDCLNEGLNSAKHFEKKAQSEVVERKYWEARDVCTT